ncbi:hypothetical protein PR048_032268 [Dryococelus australis]|uniref:Uncharacterized protein n=1 Tax=Dryococelus australis TaxID=614101 RepID=A0ABQ9G1R4_9NEOP|nr:hypothetical protein PR048_032268 [Dryococelus australis]
MEACPKTHVTLVLLQVDGLQLYVRTPLAPHSLYVVQSGMDSGMDVVQSVGVLTDTKKVALRLVKVHVTDGRTDGRTGGRLTDETDGCESSSRSGGLRSSTVSLHVVRLTRIDPSPSSDMWHNTTDCCSRCKCVSRPSRRAADSAIWPERSHVHQGQRGSIPGGVAPRVFSGSSRFPCLRPCRLSSTHDRFGAAMPNCIPRFCYIRIFWIASHYGCKFKDAFTFKNEGTIRAALKRTPSASSLLRARHAAFRRGPASEGVNVDVFTSNKRPCPRHSHIQFSPSGVLVAAKSAVVSVLPPALWPRGREAFSSGSRSRMREGDRGGPLRRRPIPLYQSGELLLAVEQPPDDAPGNLTALYQGFPRSEFFSRASPSSTGGSRGMARGEQQARKEGPGKLDGPPFPARRTTSVGTEEGGFDQASLRLGAKVRHSQPAQWEERGKICGVKEEHLRIPEISTFRAAIQVSLRAAVAEQSTCSPPNKVNRARSPAVSLPAFSQVGIVADDDASRRVFSGISRLPRPFIPAPLHTGPNLFTHLSMSAGMRKAEETGDPRENLPNSGIIRHDSHMRKFERDPARTDLPVPLGYTGRSYLSIWATRNNGVIGSRRRWSEASDEGAEKTGDPRENPPTSSIVAHGTRMQNVLDERRSQPMRMNDVCVERRRNARAVETGDPPERENLPTSDIVQYDSHKRKSWNLRRKDTDKHSEDSDKHHEDSDKPTVDYRKERSDNIAGSSSSNVRNAAVVSETDESKAPVNGNEEMCHGQHREEELFGNIPNLSVNYSDPATWG